MDRFAEKTGAFLAVPLLIAFVAGVCFAVIDAIFTGSPAPTNPDFIDRLFASDSVLAATRIAIIAAAAYLVISVFALIARRQWLTRVGPIQVSERVSEVLDENRRLRDALLQARQRIDDLQDDVEARDQELTRLADTIQAGEPRKSGSE